MKGIGEKLKLKLLQGKGKVRRFVLSTTKKKYVERQLSLRYGECKRCGACCMLVFKCPFLKTKDEVIACRIYGKRPKGCRIFPLDARDFRELKSPCGFHFPFEENKIYKSSVNY